MRNAAQHQDSTQRLMVGLHCTVGSGTAHMWPRCGTQHPSAPAVGLRMENPRRLALATRPAARVNTSSRGGFEVYRPLFVKTKSAERLEKYYFTWLRGEMLGNWKVGCGLQRCQFHNRIAEVFMMQAASFFLMFPFFFDKL